MALLLPYPRARMTHDERPQNVLSEGSGSVEAGGLLGVDLDLREVFGAHVAVLAGTDQPGGCAMISAERLTAESFRDEHVLREGVLDRKRGLKAIEAAEDDVSDSGTRSQRWLDDLPVEGLEGDTLPAQVGDRPAGNAVKVGVDLAARKARQLNRRDGEGGRHGAADLDDRFGWDWWRWPVEVRAEAGELIQRDLSGRKGHIHTVAYR